MEWLLHNMVGFFDGVGYVLLQVLLFVEKSL
jgi:hypothetical protein